MSDDDQQSPDAEQRVVKRDERGHWLPGHAPKGGRPKGVTRAERAAQFLEPHAQEALKRCLEHALSGDAQMMKLILDRVAPIPRAEGERVVVPGLAEARNVSDKARAIVAAVADGSITTEAGRSVLQMLDVLARATKLDEIERRLKAIEEGTREPRVIDADRSDLV
jgi:hypothetical protein